MSRSLRWGIMGTGNIARQFVGGLSGTPRTQVAAVGSRTKETASTFAANHKIGNVHGSYTELIADPSVDAIYLTLPNSMHHEWTIKALKAGKHVLCEKPFATNAAQSEEMFDVAEKQGLTLIEAFMYRSHPQTRKIVDLIREGAIGTVKQIRTCFCFKMAKPAGNIRYDASLAGGALMDVGCYCLSLTRLIAGWEPDQMFATGLLSSSGIDEAVSATLRFECGMIGCFSCGMQNHADNSAYICGTEGYLQIGWPWKPQREAKFTLAHNAPPKQDTKTSTTAARPATTEYVTHSPYDLYGCEAEAFADAALDGKSPFVSRAATIGNMKCLDELRRQVGVKF